MTSASAPAPTLAAPRPTHQLARFLPTPGYARHAGRTVWVRVGNPIAYRQMLRDGEILPATLAYDTNLKSDLCVDGGFSVVEASAVELLPIFGTPDPQPFADWLAAGERERHGTGHAA